MANRINGEREHAVHDSHENGIDPSTEISGSESDEYADESADDRGTDGDDHGDAGAIDDTG